MSEVKFGISEEELQEQIIERAACKLAGLFDENAYDKVSNIMLKKVQGAVDAAVTKIIDEKVLPMVNGGVEGLILQETTKWGEKVGEPLTFTEYLIKRAEIYMTETVNYDGKSKAENGSYSSWNGTQTRITNMVHRHLQYSIETAMKQALADANKHIVGGIEKAVRLKMEELSKQFTVVVQGPR